MRPINDSRCNDIRKIELYHILTPSLLGLLFDCKRTDTELNKSSKSATKIFPPLLSGRTMMLIVHLSGIDNTPVHSDHTTLKLKGDSSNYL